MILKNGVKLDDFAINEKGRDLSYAWTQICESSVPVIGDVGCIAEGEGSGLCGVEDCLNDSVHYLDLDKKDIIPCEDHACHGCDDCNCEK